MMHLSMFLDQVGSNLLLVLYAVVVLILVELLVAVVTGVCSIDRISDKDEELPFLTNTYEGACFCCHLVCFSVDTSTKMDILQEVTQ